MTVFISGAGASLKLLVALETGEITNEFFCLVATADFNLRCSGLALGLSFGWT